MPIGWNFLKDVHDQSFSIQQPLAWRTSLKAINSRVEIAEEKQCQLLFSVGLLPDRMNSD